MSLATSTPGTISGQAELSAILEALPAATASYLALLVATYALHALFMNYTFGAALWMAAAAVRGRYSAGAPRDVLASVVRDWLPSSVSGAVTAGIAPLLFVQIVYQKSFYTANILLFNRWMALLPALIVAVYAMYAVKAHGEGRAAFLARHWAKAAAGIVAALLVGFVGLAFVENHLLSLATDSWIERYEHNAPVAPSAAAWMRLAMWALGALPTFAALAAWQLLAQAGGATSDDRVRAARPLAFLAIVGGTASLAIGLIVWRTGTVGSRLLDDRAGRAAFGALSICLLAGGAAWLAIAVRRDLGGWLVAVAVAASAGATLSHAMLREGARLLALHGTPAAPREPSGIGGLTIFLVFLVLAAGLVAWIVRTVARSLDAPGLPPGAAGSSRGRS